MKKEHVANLFGQMKFFSPKLTHGEFHGEFLVNQIAVDKYKGQQAALGKPVLITCPPDRDTLLDLIGKAGLEMKLFMKMMDDAQDINEKLIRELKDYDEECDMILGSRGSEMSLAEKFQTVMGRYKQMAQFVKDVVEYSEAPPHILKPAQFLHSKIDQPLVNQNAQKETPTGGPVLKPGTGNIDLSASAKGGDSGPSLQVLPFPTETATGTDSVGATEVQAEESKGVAPQDSDQH